MPLVTLLGEGTLVGKHSSQTFPVIGYSVFTDTRGDFGSLHFADPLQTL